MNAQDIRNKYLEFYAKQQHAIVKRAPLFLTDDPTTLFTGAGMQPMIPYLLGETHPQGKRIADSQTCLRAQDIDDIGDNRHTTFFEMLGNWSLGDYFKKEQITWMWTFLTEEVGLDPNRLYVTCFIGAPEYNIAKDTEAAELWRQKFAEKGIEAKSADIGSEEPLFGDEGLGLDSVDALELGLAVQKTFGFQLDGENDNLRDNFANVKTLAEFVRSRQAQG